MLEYIPVVHHYIAMCTLYIYYARYDIWSRSPAPCIAINFNLHITQARDMYIVVWLDPNCLLLLHLSYLTHVKYVLFY